MKNKNLILSYMMLGIKKAAEQRPGFMKWIC